tara:strand:- start:241 stop:708 length:468 start_codon:yes stop_codon:yes gene_type:complete
MKLTKSKLKEIIREEFLKEQTLFPVKVDMQVDFTGTESNEEKFVADIEKAIQGVIDNSGVNITWTVNDYSMNEEIQRLNEEKKWQIFFVTAMHPDPEDAEGWISVGKNKDDAWKNLYNYFKKETKRRGNDMKFYRTQISPARGSRKNKKPWTQVQ